MLDIYLTRTLGGALKPVDGMGEEYIASLKVGEQVRAQFKKERNPGHHRKFFGLLRMVFKNQETYLSEEALRFAVMIQAGYVEHVMVNLPGEDMAHFTGKLREISKQLGGVVTLETAADALERLSKQRTVLKPQSIAWAKMDQHEFDKFYKAALEAIPRLLPQFDGVDLDKELLMGSDA